MPDNLEQLLSNVELIPLEGLDESDAFASVTLNPTLRWMKFILTDDQPNENKQRVPPTEFENLIKSGVHMPIKMANGKILPGHDEAYPIGVITNLKQTHNKIEGLAALWSRERPDDVEYIINEFRSGKTPQISWEIPFTEIKEEDGIQNLTGICLRAATLVGLPAYAGRTPVLAVASKTDEGVINMPELEALQTELAEAKVKLEELETAKASADEELKQLREFKAQVDKEQADAEKLATIKAKFAEAGLKKEDEYFITNRDMLLVLDEAALNFMVQELAAFAQASINKPDKPEIPPLTNNDIVNTNDVKALATALRARHQKK